ncbi:MAG: FGGY family carbohydrate kinase [Gammaproteobacteria bacterium]
MAIAAQMDSPLFLTIDQGGHGSRVHVYDESGILIAHSHQAITPVKPRPCFVEYDPEQLISSVRRAIHDIVEQLDDQIINIKTAGLATQRSNVACWNRQTGQYLSPIISWQDTRHSAWIAQFKNREDRIHDITGLFPSAHYGASKIRWCLDNLPALTKCIDNEQAAIGPMSTLLCFELLREKPHLADPVNASRTLLWDYHQLNWSSELSKLFDIPLACLPGCVPSRHPFGKLNIGGADIPLDIVTGDQSAALFAFGKPQVDTAYITLGTGAFIQLIYKSDNTAISQHLLTSVVHQDASDILISNEATINGTGSALDWLSGESGKDMTSDDLERILNDTQTSLIFLNGISGLGSPWFIPDFQSRFIGDGNVAEKYVAVIESIVFLIQLNLETMIQETGVIRRIIIGGGLSILDSICQRLADISGIDVHRSPQYETTSRGLFNLITKNYADQTDKLDRPFSPKENDLLIKRYMKWKEMMLNETGSLD